MPGAGCQVLRAGAECRCKVQVQGAGAGAGAGARCKVQGATCTITYMARTMPCAIALVIYAATSLDATITTLERQRLISHLQMTSAWLLDEVSGLSRAQLEFKPSPTSWNILQVVDHLVVVGPIYWQDLQRALKAPASARESVSTDADLLWYGIDRSRPEDAIPTELPKGASDLRSALDAYRTAHARLVEFVKTTDQDLRRHFVERQGCDAYQWALLISTHEQRHILQIRQIKAHAKFPSR